MSSLRFFPYAVYMDALGEWHQATFFYESMWNVCLLIAMLIVSRKKPKTGTLTCMYFVIYGLGRFLIEGFRTDSLYMIPGIRVSQVLSLFLICGGILLYTFFVRRNKTKNVYLGRYMLLAAPQRKPYAFIWQWAFLPALTLFHLVRQWSLAIFKWNVLFEQYENTKGKNESTI